MQPEVLISEPEISSRVDSLARSISADYEGLGEIVLVGVLRGAFIFLADLSRRLTVERRIDFIAVSSYAGAHTSGAVRLIMDARTDLKGRHVLIVEDIVDTGHTLAYLRGLLGARRPASLKSAVLVRKPSRAEVEVPIDYLGFDIPDAWVVGYGLDLADRHRTLPYIGVVETD